MQYETEQCGNGGSEKAKIRAKSTRTLKAAGISREQADSMSADKLQESLEAKGIDKSVVEAELERKEKPAIAVEVEVLPPKKKGLTTSLRQMAQEASEIAERIENLPYGNSRSPKTNSLQLPGEASSSKPKKLTDQLKQTLRDTEEIQKGLNRLKQKEDAFLDSLSQSGAKAQKVLDTQNKIKRLKQEIAQQISEF